MLSGERRFPSWRDKSTAKGEPEKADREDESGRRDSQSGKEERRSRSGKNHVGRDFIEEVTDEEDGES